MRRQGASPSWRSLRRAPPPPTSSTPAPTCSSPRCSARIARRRPGLHRARHLPGLGGAGHRVRARPTTPTGSTPERPESYLQAHADLVAGRRTRRASRSRGPGRCQKACGPSAGPISPVRSTPPLWSETTSRCQRAQRSSTACWARARWLGPASVVEGSVVLPGAHLEARFGRHRLHRGRMAPSWAQAPGCRRCR